MTSLGNGGCARSGALADIRASAGAQRGRYRGHVADLSEDSGAPLIIGFDWMLSCTTDFESTLAFVRDVLGLEVFKQGTAQTDRQFARYACAALPSGDVLEVVEPVQAAEHVRGRQILCLKVRNIEEARRELGRRGAAFASDMVYDGEGVGWIYVRAPDGNIYQFYGPVADEEV
jgi:catechol 2,3-dioxygenase-like lactoylglutathione lyase family enzyme